MERPLLERFVSKIEVHPGGCWLWIGHKNPKGYGVLFRTKLAHRVALTLEGVTIPEGMVVDHRCRNRACVKPSHLRIVSPRQNVLENSVGLAATNKKKTHCPQGHPYDEANTYVVRSDTGIRRQCRTCTNERNRRDRIILKSSRYRA